MAENKQFTMNSDSLPHRFGRLILNTRLFAVLLMEVSHGEVQILPYSGLSLPIGL